jgi:hypothetical protein
MRDVLRTYETDGLEDTADYQDLTEEKDHCDRGHNWIDQRKESGENHQTTLYEIPKRMPPNRFSHCLAHGLGSRFE